jgi:DNA-binding transcriptional ArsR family regulator
MKEATDPSGQSKRVPEMEGQQDPLQSQRCARKLAALAAPERLRIVHFLRAGPRNVTEIAEMLHTAPVNVSHHMHVLTEAGLVQREKRGRFVLYSLTQGVLETDGQDAAHDHLNLGCCRIEIPREDDSGEAAPNSPC